MRKRDIRPGKAYGDGKKGKRLVLIVCGDQVRYRMIAMTRPHDLFRVGGTYDVKLAHFASWAVEIIHDADSFLHDVEVQRSLDEDARRQAGSRKKPRPLPCGHCGQSRPLAAYRLEQRTTVSPVCAACEDTEWEAYAQARQAEKAGPPPATAAAALSVNTETQSVSGAAPSPRYANVGRSRSLAKGVSSRQNGRKGGRPPRWSEAVRVAAAEVLRAARVGDRHLAEELAHFARAIEEGRVR